MQLGLNKHLQPHEIKSYKHKIKNSAFPPHSARNATVYAYAYI